MNGNPASLPKEKIDRWKCTSYCLCGSRRGHFERSDTGEWMLAADALTEIEELKTEIRAQHAAYNSMLDKAAELERRLSDER